MQKIHVKRYNQPAAGFSGTIEPDDRSWILFVPTDGTTPSLWERSESSEDGDTVSTYIKT